MAQVRLSTFSVSAGLDGTHFQHKILDALRDQLAALGTTEGVDAIHPELTNPAEEGAFDAGKPFIERNFHVQVTSMQGIQRSEEMGDYDAIHFAQVFEQFDTGVICIGFMIITNKGIMADAIEPAITECLTTAVKVVADESNGGIAVRGMSARNGKIRERFTAGAEMPPEAEAMLPPELRGGDSPLGDVMGRLMDMMRPRPKKEEDEA